jgi:hypothetical protein
MKNKRIIYWGGNDHTIIPRMGACGEGVDVEPAAGAGGPQKPAASASAPDGPGLFDKLKGLLPALALGALALGVIGGVALLLRKNRDGKDIDFDPDLSDSENFAKLGLDIEGARTANRSANMGQNGFDENGLPVPPDFVGQQIIDEDGNVWVYKDPPGEWINFGNVDVQYTTSGDSQNPVYENYVSRITGVVNETTLRVEESWLAQSTRIGNVGSWNSLQENWWINWLQNPKDLYTYLQFDNDASSLVVNFQRDDTNFVEYPHSVVYKLYEPLPDSITEGDLTYVVREMAPPYTDTVQLVDFVEEDIDAVVLRNPKWDTGTAADSYFVARDTKFKSYDDLVTSDTDIKEIIENEIVSGSFLESIELTGVDHRQWENFVHFSSIEDRLKNFKYKLQKIELYNSQSNSLHGISGSMTYEYTASLKTKVRKLENEFTPFENYMYFQSSSYISSSIGVFYDNAWPKDGGSGTKKNPYSLYPVTSSKATTWYNEQINSASLWDRENRDRLINNIPKHITDDTNNSAFTTFINMTGEHFDNIWTYINEIPQIYDRRQKITEGLSRDLIYAVGTSLGFYFNDGKDLVDLPRYLVGYEATGSGDNANTFTEYSSTPERDISREIWKRIVNNMPFFLKTKGTLRSFKGLITCYGIPSTILRVKEYGGPDPKPDAQPSYFVDRNFTKALDFKGEQYVLTTWANDTNSSRKPDTIEFRFRSQASSGSFQTLFQAGANPGGFAIGIKEDTESSTDNYGHVSFRLAHGSDSSKGYAELSSSAFPLHDGEFYSVALTRVSSSGAQLAADTTSQRIKYRLMVKKYDEGRSKIYLESDETITINGAVSSSWNGSFTGDETAYIGGALDNSFGNQFTGSMMEFRYWNTALSESYFNNHVRAPKSFDGNHASASWTDLVLRYSFDDNKALNSDGDIRDTSADQSYTQSGSAQGYTSGIAPHFRSVVDEEKMRIPNLGPNRRVSNKIRLEDNKLKFGGLSVDKRSEVSQYDLASLDSNKLGIYFSPTDVVNEDIIRSVANLDFDNYIGDPRDQYKLRYRTLEDVSSTYWQKYTSPNNFWDYIRLIRYYDSSLFEQLRRFVPARARASVGLLIEPNILERKKQVVGKQPEFENLMLRAHLDISNQYSSSAFYPSYVSGSGIDGLVTRITGSNLQYEGSASFFEYAMVTGSYNTYEGAVTASIGPGVPALYVLSSSFDGWGGGPERFGEVTFKDTFGGPEKVFREALQVQVTGSRTSEHNYYYKFFYTTDYDAFQDHGYQWDTEKRNYSSRSLHRSDHQNIGYDNAYLRLAFLGSKQTKFTTLDKEPPVSITVTSPTTLVTQEPGESKLRVK